MAKIVFRDPSTADLIVEHSVTAWHVSEETEFQQVDVFETVEFGMTLALGGVINVTERDEMGYHEMLAHVPLLAHPNPRRVLIIGGGDGGTLREVVKHPSVEEAVMVEIDEFVVDVSKKYLPGCASAFEDPKANLIIGDGLAYVRDAADDSFDVILVDSTDPVDAAVELFTPEFYADCKRVLADGGILVPQSDSIQLYPDRVAKIAGSLREIYDRVDFYLTFVPTYPGTVWSFAFAVTGETDCRRVDMERYEAIEGSLRYYTPELHRAAFALPRTYSAVIGE